MHQLSPGTQVLVVSPHFDDAVLSCWGLLADKSIPTDVLTVCGGIPAAGLSSWDKVCGFDDGRSAAAARRMEDQKALDGLARRAWSLSVIDGAYGGGDRAAAAHELTDAIESWHATHRGGGTGLAIALPAGAGLVLSREARPSNKPLGRGGRHLEWLRSAKHTLYLRKKRLTQSKGMLAHSDHIFTRDIGLAAVEHLDDLDVLIYEELPYLWSAPGDVAVMRVARNLSRDLLEFTMDVEQKAKHESLHHYASQLPVLDAQHRLERPDALPRHERYWLLPRSSSRSSHR